VLTNVVTSVEITGSGSASYTEIEPLVKTTARHFEIDEVSADKAYSGKINLQRAVHNPQSGVG
jgi:hypothetical protein